MKILGIETSCDDTAAAIVELSVSSNRTDSMSDSDRQNVSGLCTLLSNVLASSMDIHVRYGGVVPEIAARSHIESINPVIEEALAQANCMWDDIDGIAVTYGAGLGGSLLIGVLAARTLAIAKNKPLYACNHVIGHVYANFLTQVKKLAAHSAVDEQSEPGGGGLLASEAMLAPEGRLASPNSESHLGGVHPSAGGVALTRAPAYSTPTSLRATPVPHTGVDPLANYRFPSRQPQFPMLAIIVSGGHSQLALFHDHFGYTLLGQTRDDAIGEAFDKVAKILGLPYPGGPSVSKLALEGDAHKYDLPIARLSPRQPLDSSITEDDKLNNRRRAVYKSTVKDPGNDAALRAIVASGKYDFSYSGLKTAVLRLAQAETGNDYTFPSTKLPDALTERQKADIAASFQRIAVETIVDKAVLACEEFQPTSVVIAGGVAASPELRRQLTERLPRLSGRQDGQALPIEFPDLKLCTDNGAMIATLGCFMALYDQPKADPYSLDIAPNLSM